MPKLTEYKDMSPRAKAVVEGIAQARGIDPANINNVWKALARHPSVMERLAAEMKGAFARQQPIAQEPLRPLETAALREVPVVGDEQVPDVLRVVGEKDQLPARPVRDEIAVGACERRQEVQRVGAEAIRP